MVDPTVTAVEKQLTQPGYYSGPIDGIYGPLVRDAVAKYQIGTNQECNRESIPGDIAVLRVVAAGGRLNPTSYYDQMAACCSFPARAPSPTRMALVFASTSRCGRRASLTANLRAGSVALIAAERNWESEVVERKLNSKDRDENKAAQ